MLAREDPEELRRHALDEDFPAFVNPLGRAVGAGVHARVGDHDVAERMVRRSLDQLDREASYLLQAARCADAALQLDVPELWREILGLLEPWAARFAVDSNGWWCDGPVALWIAGLEVRLGRSVSSDAVATGEATAPRMGDRRSLQRVHRLRAHPADSRPRRVAETGALTERELAVVRLMATGATNRRIAHELAYSLGAIRADTSAIYRKLGNQGCVDTVAVAVELGLLSGDGSV